MWTRLASACLMASLLSLPAAAGTLCGQDGDCRDPLSGLEPADSSEAPGPAAGPKSPLRDPLDAFGDGDRQGVAAVAPPVLEGRVPQLAGTPTAQMPGMAPQQPSGGAPISNLPSAAPSAPAPSSGGFVSPATPATPTPPDPPQPFTIRLPFFGPLE